MPSSQLPKVCVAQFSANAVFASMSIVKAERSADLNILAFVIADWI